MIAGLLSHPRFRRATVALGVLACLGAGVGRAAGDPPDQQRALLDLVVNEVVKGSVYALVRPADVLVPVDVLERAGLQGFAGRREIVAGVSFVSLASLGPEVSYRLDEAGLAVRIHAPARMLDSVRIDIKNSQRPQYAFAPATSAFLNYGFHWLEGAGYSATAEAGLSMKGALATTTFTRTEAGSIVRNLSTVVFDDRTRLRRLEVGDTFVGDRLLGGALFMGGVRVAREYSIDPYFIQFPMLSLAGAAATPSTVEVYVDNRLVRQERVQPGRFELANVPVPSGSSHTRVVVRDAFGREQQISSPFYLTTNVLAKGLHEFEYSVGFPRSSIGSVDDRYGSLGAFGRHRYGFSDSLTAGVRAEGQADLVNGGPSLNLRLPLGDVEASVAASRDTGRTGYAVAFGYGYTSQALSVGVNLRAFSESYSTLSLRSVQDRPRSAVGAFAGFRLRPGVSLNLQQSFAETHGGRRTTQSAVMVATQLGARTHAFGRVGRSQIDGTWRNEASVGLSIALGARSMATISATGEGGRASANVEVLRSLPLGEGLGYRVRGGTGSDDFAGGRLEYQGRHGRVEAGHERVNGSGGTSVGVAGGVVAIGGAVFATRPVEDGFALIRVPGVPGVRGFLSNQEVGRTNGRGDLLIPNLLPYYANRLSIADEDVPLDHAVSGIEQSVATPYRGGALVLFGSRLVQGVAGSVVISESGGVVVPEFGDVSVVAGGRQIESPVGRGGSFYLEALPPGAHRAVVRYLGRSCTFTIVVPAATGAVVDIGQVRCPSEAR